MQSIIFRNVFTCLEKSNYMKDNMKVNVKLVETEDSIPFALTLLNISYLLETLRKIPWFHLISWCEKFMERHSFRIISGDSPKTMRKLCLSTKFPHQEIRWNYGILCSGNEKCYTIKSKATLIDLNKIVKNYFLELWIHLVLLLWNVDHTPGNFLFIKNP